MRFFPPALRVAALVVALFALSTGSLTAADLYQVSTIEALSAGLYDGRERIGALGRHGDFGIGTLAGLDGEVVVLDGVFYQVRSDGTVHRVGPGEKTPFVQVTFFTGELDLGRLDGLSFAALKAALTARLPDPAKFYAVRVEGMFPTLTVRSVAAQQKPWPTLAEAIKGQSVFPLENIQGTLVGFYSPQSAPGLSPTGWHFHFLSRDRAHGGHVLDGTAGPTKARGDMVTAMTTLFPDKPLPRQGAAAPAAGTE
jgi:acetolactate decarboxylase